MKKQANAVATETTAKAVITTAELAKSCGTTAKKLRRYLRAQKFQRTEKRWGLDSKIQDQAIIHFTKPKAPEAQPAKE